MNLNLNRLNLLLRKHNISVSEEIHNGKSSESYVRSIFIQDDGFSWETVVPYYIRCSGIFMETDEDVADYLIKIKPYFTASSMKRWAENERAK